MLNQEIIEKIAVYVVETNRDPRGKIEADPEGFKAALSDMEAKRVVMSGTMLANVHVDTEGVSMEPPHGHWCIDKMALKKEYGIEID